MDTNGLGVGQMRDLGDASRVGGYDGQRITSALSVAQQLYVGEPWPPALHVRAGD